MTFGYEVAGIGSRFIAALVDTTLLVVALVVLNLLLVVGLSLAGASGQLGGRGLAGNTAGWVGGLVLAVYALLNFGLIWGYYIVFELVWNGQTPGKRLAGIRVIRSDGNAAGAIEVIVRNLVRVVDFLPLGYGIGLITMFFNRRARRLGDFAAGTLVVKERKDVTLASLRPAATPSAAPPAAVGDNGLLGDMPTWRVLSAADYDLVQETLDRWRRRAVDEAVLVRLAGVIAARLGCPAPRWGQAHQFLEEVASRYRGQRTE